MSITSDITAAAAKLSPASSSGLLGHQIRVADLLLTDLDAVFWLIKLACGTCDRHIQEVLDLLDEVSEAVTDSEVRAANVRGTASHLDTAERHLAVASTETSGEVAQRRVGLAAAALVKYAGTVGGGVGGSLPLSPDEAAIIVNDALSQIEPLLGEIDRIQRQLDQALPSLPRCQAPASNGRASAVMSAVLDLRAGIYRGARGRTLTALAAAASLRKAAVVPDVTAAKWEGEIIPDGPAGRASITSTLSAPYDIKAGSVLSLVVDGTAVDWTLPVGTAASITTAELGTTTTFTSGVDDELTFYANTVLVTVTFGTGAKTRGQIASAISSAAGANATASVVSNAIVIVSDVTGPSSSLWLSTGTANSLLGLQSYQLTRGAGVSVLELQQSASTAGLDLVVLGSYRKIGTATATGMASTTLSFSGSSIPTGTAVGDSILLTGTSSATAGTAWYRVVAVNSVSGVPTTLTVDRSVPVGAYPIEVISDKLKLSSLLAEAGSEMSVLTGVTSIGLASQSSRSGSLRCAVADLPTTRPVLAGDILRLASGDVSIRAVTTGHLTLASSVSDTEDAEVYALGSVRSLALDSGIATWREDRLSRKHDKYSTMGFDKVVASLSGKGSKTQALAVVESVRTTLEELQTLVRGYDAAPRPLLSAAITATRSDKYDLAADMLMEGRVVEFLALTEDVATYNGDLSAGLVGVGSSLPTSNVDLSTYTERPAPEPAFVDDDEDDPNDDGLVLQDDDDEGGLVF